MNFLLACLILLTGAEDPAPPSSKTTSPGPLVLHGGGKGSDNARTLALKLGGGKDAHVLILPQASSEAAEAAAELTDLFKTAGASHIEVLEPSKPDAARAAIDQATVIWMTGGDQSRLLDALGPDLSAAIRHRHAQGAVVGGTSAGTAATTRIMITGNPDNPGDPTPTSTGLDLWPGVVVDQHFVVRKRQERLRRVVADHPGTIGVGVDESSFIVVRGRSFEVNSESAGPAVVISTHGPDLTIPPGKSHTLHALAPAGSP